MTGDVATSGLWFFLCRDHGLPLEPAAIPALTARAWSIRRGLESRGVAGDGGEAIDRVVLHGPPSRLANDGRAFVLCTAETVLHFAADDPYRTGLTSCIGSPAHMPE